MSKAQYDKVGAAFLKHQKAFYEGKGDETGKFISDSIAEANMMGYNKNVLDLGCGDGSRFPFLTGLGRRMGLDESEFMVKKAREANVYSSVYKGSMEDIPLPNDCVDIVTARFSLLILRGLDKTYDEVNRVLRPDGLFVAVVAHPLEGLFRQKGKTYGKVEAIDVPLFDGKVTVRDYSHSFSDYISRRYLQHFDLFRLYEGKQMEAHLPGVDYVIPGFLGFAGVKRR